VSFNLEEEEKNFQEKDRLKKFMSRVKKETRGRKQTVRAP
jgi:hypothetical protein